MGSKRVRWLTQVTNLWGVGLTLDPRDLNPEIHCPTDYISIPVLGSSNNQNNPQGRKERNTTAETCSHMALQLATYHHPQGWGRLWGVHRRGRRRNGWGSLWLTDWWIKTPSGSPVPKSVEYFWSVPQHWPIYLDWAWLRVTTSFRQLHHQLSVCRLPPSFTKAKKHVALWFCFYKLSYHSTCMLEPRC